MAGTIGVAPRSEADFGWRGYEEATDKPCTFGLIGIPTPASRPYFTDAPVLAGLTGLVLAGQAGWGGSK
ncbi:MAG TPA: hypothetical protein VED59_01945 [Acidimicrobiales bacterium]|nr:hypothetical protein [Acidimicrobiales bacterium]